MKGAHVSGMAAYQALCDKAEADYEGYWAGLAREFVSWKTPFTKVLDESQCALLQVVRGRHAERVLQLPGPQCRGRQGRQGGDHLRGRRRQGHARHLQAAARTHLPAGQRPEVARRQEGRPRRHLHVDEHRGRGRDAGLRAHRRHPLGGLRRLLGAVGARPRAGRRRGDDHHRRRAVARRQAAAAEGHRRRGHRARRLRHASRTWSSTSAPAARSPGTRRATAGCTS